MEPNVFTFYCFKYWISACTALETVKNEYSDRFQLDLIGIPSKIYIFIVTTPATWFTCRNGSHSTSDQIMHAMDLWVVLTAFSVWPINDIFCYDLNHCTVVVAIKIMKIWRAPYQIPLKWIRRSIFCCFNHWLSSCPVLETVEMNASTDIPWIYHVSSRTPMIFVFSNAVPSIETIGLFDLFTWMQYAAIQRWYDHKWCKVIFILSF